MDKIRTLDTWLLGNSYDFHSENTDLVVKMGMCEGRHEIPDVNDYVFKKEVDLSDFDKLESTAYDKLKEIFKNSNTGLLRLYLTGATPCFIAIGNACRRLGVALTVFNFDPTTNSYKKQIVRFPLAHEVEE